MKVMSVVGARPQFVKLASIADEAKRRDVEHIIVHTGQHYDPLLSDVFFRDLEIPTPEVHLGIGSGSHGRQTGEMLAALDAVLPTYSPDWILTYGDTNSTLAAALAGVKLHFPVAHLEAGLRSFNRIMPEEHNRVLTDHAADLLLAPTHAAMMHLEAEGLRDRSRLVGDVMIDVLYKVRDTLTNLAELPQILDVPSTQYSIATIHRAENTDSAERLNRILVSLSEVDHPVVLLAHPRLRAKAREHGIAMEQGNLRVRDPLSYPNLIAAIMLARGVITDSGGLQKEAFALRTPCTTVRSETEWSETVELGWNVLTEPGVMLTNAVQRTVPIETSASPYGNGSAAAAVFDTFQS